MHSSRGLSIASPRGQVALKPVVAAPAPNQGIRATALAAFKPDAAMASAIELQMGETLWVLSQDGDWWYGRTRRAEGYFPRTYVKLETL